MHNTWFTSDTHFGHKAILEYESEARPFANVDEMNEVMIERWNSVVRANDTVFHLGDFCFGKSYLYIAGRLNGKKKLVMGNHDMYPSSDYLLYFGRLMGVCFWKMATLSHIPIDSRLLGNRSILSIHGHLHNKIMTDSRGNEDRNYFNVSVERHNLTPVHSDIIMERLKELE